MILEGFEIENWSCIKRVAVDRSATGRRHRAARSKHHGKEQHCRGRGAGSDGLMTASRLQGSSSNGSARTATDKPRVGVVSTQGSARRITKQFGTRESKLESRTAAGAWKPEQATAADAHERVRQLIGGKDSDAGLQQLLWLSQAEFQLPDPKKFDSDVQSQLRTVLGVLQTPLDDRFLRRVKEEWSRWFGARSKPGEKPKLKKDCPHDKALAALEQHKDELDKIETEYRTFETMMEKSGNLEILSCDLRRPTGTTRRCEQGLLQRGIRDEL